MYARQYRIKELMNADLFFAAGGVQARVVDPRPSFQKSQVPRTVLILTGHLGCGTHGYFRAVSRK